MQLASDSQIPDGLLAAMTLLSEKPRHGVTSWESAPHPGIGFRISSTVINFHVQCSGTASDLVVAPSNFAQVQGRGPSRTPQQCQALANRINRVLNDIAKRQSALNNNPGNLPLFLPGATRAVHVQGHQDILGEQIDNLAALASEYQNGCGGGPPAAPTDGSPVTLPVPIVVPPILVPMSGASEGATAGEILTGILEGLLAL